MRKKFGRSETVRAAQNLALGLAALSLSCSADAGDEPSANPAAGGSGGVLAASGGGGAPNPLGTPRCQPPPGMNGSPQTIEEAIALLNALPKPTSVACFLQSLDRPLVAFATSSVFSAQPALSARSPRVFLRIGRLWLSVVIDGDSSYLIELSHLEADDVRSIKGEVQLPINEALPASAPYERVRFGAGTACGLCHTSEVPAPGVSFTQAFASTAFRPRNESRVGLERLLSERRLCDWSAEPHRCEMLSALFDGGGILEESFPGSMPTFF